MTVDLGSPRRDRPPARPVDADGSGRPAARPQLRHPALARVTAVVVARDAGAGLERVLDAVARQTRPADTVVGVTGSGAVQQQLEAQLDAVAVVPDPVPASRDTVHAALRARPAGAGDRADAPDASGAQAASGGQAGTGAADEWLWLLRDGAAPAPDALEHLLRAVELGPSIGVAGCKLRDWHDEHLLRDAGFTTTRFGRLMTGVDLGDVDQGQLDHREDVLAVGTDGMLVRRSLLLDLDGADPALSGPAAALDLCRRARLAGHRVVVVPAAVVTTTDPGRIGPGDTAHLRLVHAPLPLLPFVALAVLAGAVTRLLLRVAAKDAGRGAHDLVDVLRVLGRPDRLWRSRRALSRTRSRPRRDLTPLLVGSRETARWHRDRWSARRARSRLGRAEPVPERGPLGRRLLPAALVTSLLAAVSLVVWHRLLGPGPVSGGALAAAPASASDVLDSLRSGWRTSGLGEAGAADPFTAVVLVAVLLAGGATQAAVTGLLVLALPVAGLGAWCAAGRGTCSRAVRGWAALTWSAGPALLVASGTGRLGPVVAHAALPYVVWAVVATVQSRQVRYAWTPAAAGGLVLAAVVAGAPVLLLPAVLTLVVLALTHRSRALPLLWAAVPAVALAGPWLVDAARRPRALLAAPGTPLPAETAPGWQQLLGHPVPAGSWPLLPEGLAAVAPLLASGVVVLLAVVALARGGATGRVVRTGWLVAALGLATAVAATRTDVAAGTETLVTGWPGAGLSLALAGLLTAVVAAADGVRDRIGGHAFGWRQAGVAVLSVLAVLAPVATLTVWTVQHATRTGQEDRAPLPTRASGPRLPEVAVDAARSGDQVRTLVLAAEADSVRLALVRGAGVDLLDASTVVAAGTLAPATPWSRTRPAAPDAADTALDTAAALLVRGGGDPRPALADLAVGYVLLRPGPDAGTLAETLDSTVGLVRAGQSGDVLAWRVEPVSGQVREGADRPAALRLLELSGEPVAVLATGPTGTTATLPPSEDGRPRHLVLAERADPGWTATVDGHHLERLTHAGWAQAFEVPAAGGRLELRHETPWQPAWSLGQAAVGLVSLLLAVPMPGARRGRAEA